MIFAYAVWEGGTVDVVIRSSHFHTFSNDMKFAIHGCYVVGVRIDHINTSDKTCSLLLLLLLLLVLLSLVLVFL